MSIVEEEIDEVIYWMELLVDAEILKKSLLESLVAEAKELLAITVASANTARGKPRQKQ